jgi:hypothetical protein
MTHWEAELREGGCGAHVGMDGVMDVQGNPHLYCPPGPFPRGSGLTCPLQTSGSLFLACWTSFVVVKETSP